MVFFHFLFLTRNKSANTFGKNDRGWVNKPKRVTVWEVEQATTASLLNPDVEKAAAEEESQRFLPRRVFGSFKREKLSRRCDLSSSIAGIEDKE